MREHTESILVNITTSALKTEKRVSTSFSVASRVRRRRPHPKKRKTKNDEIFKRRKKKKQFGNDLVHISQRVAGCLSQRRRDGVKIKRREISDDIIRLSFPSAPTESHNIRYQS